MNPIRPLLLCVWLAVVATVPVAAQGSMERVVPGRDFAGHKLLTPGLTDTWKLDVESDEVLWCIVESSTFDPVLELVDDRGAVVGSDDGVGTRSELWHRAASKGAYEFRVSPYKGSGGGHYSYHLHRFRTAPLGVPGEATHTFGKESWWHYRVALRVGDVLVPTVLGEGRLTAVLDARCDALTEEHGGYRALHTGDHYVRIEGAEGRGCQTLTQLARSGECRLGNARAERIAPYGLDTWRCRLPAGASVVLDLCMPEVLLGFDLREVEAKERGPGFVAMGHFDKGGRKRRLLFARSDSVLELVLRHQGSAVAPYELAVRPWGRDVAVGERVDGQLPLGDGVLFHLPLPAGEMVDVAVASEQFDATIDVLDPDANLLAQADDRSLVDRNPLHRFLVTRPGTYHVLVHCCGGLGSGAFTLTTTSRPLPRLAVGERLVVQPGGHVHLDLTTGETVWLSLRSAAFDGALQVVDPTGDGGFVAEGGGVGGDVLVAYRSSHTGRHTLLVHARSGHGDGELRVVRP